MHVERLEAAKVAAVCQCGMLLCLSTNAISLLLHSQAFSRNPAFSLSACCVQGESPDNGHLERPYLPAPKVRMYSKPQ